MWLDPKFSYTMRILVCLTAVLLSIFALPEPARCQDFYDIETVNTIELTFAESNWDEILDSLYLLGEDDHLIGSAVINGVFFDSVGVRYKGNSSYSPDRTKNPLNVTLDYVIEDQTYQGYGTLKLANLFKDPSFVREVISYEIARTCMDAGKANFANVYINGDLIGLYSNVQSVDKLYLNEHFYSEDYPLFKGELSGVASDEIVVWGYYGDLPEHYEHYYEMKSDEGWEELIYFLDVFNHDPAQMEEVLDVDAHLWMLAFDILLVNLDAPVNFGHNFYLYQDHLGEFHPLVWDLNESFGAFNRLVGGIPLATTDLQQLPPFLNLYEPNYPIITQVLSHPTYRKIYLAHMKTLMDDLFSSGWFLNRALEIQDIITESVYDDPNKFYSYSDFRNNIYNSVTSGPGTVIGLTELMDARIDYLTTHDAFQGSAPVITNISVAPVNPVPQSQITLSAHIIDADLVVLGYRYSPADAFQQTEMYDDGSHDDGFANDGIFGAQINTADTDVQYYLFAENSEAVCFAPPRAEFDYFTIEVEKSLVINELMAANDTVLADPQGDYDDWIELYNASDSSMNLEGWYLSDDLSEPDQWALPDTMIPGNGYLLIWADDDEGDNGLHTNFRLSAGGEILVLSRMQNDSVHLVDLVGFGPQSDDTAYGRFPDGSDELALLYATPGSSNVILEPPAPPLPDKLVLYPAYPNPFNGATIIGFELPQAGQLSLEVFDITGRCVDRRRRWRDAGYQSIPFDGTRLASGIYFYRLTFNGVSTTKKLVVLK